MHERDIAIRDLTDDLLARRIDRRSFVRRATALGVSATAVSALLAGPARGAAGATRGGTLQFGMSVEPLPLDPVKLNWGDESQLDLFERLIVRNRRGAFEDRCGDGGEGGDGLPVKGRNGIRVEGRERGHSEGRCRGFGRIGDQSRVPRT